MILNQLVEFENFVTAYIIGRSLVAYQIGYVADRYPRRQFQTLFLQIMQMNSRFKIANEIYIYIYINNQNYNNWLIILIFKNILWKMYEKSWFIFTWVRLKNSSHDTGPQSLNNSCSHCIRKFQILCPSIVNERVRDSMKAYRSIYTCICD